MPKPKDWNGAEWKGRKPGSYQWFEIQDAVDYYKEFERKKIIIPDIALRLQGMYDEEGFYCVNTAYIIPVDDKYLLGILNSNLIQFIYSKISSSIRGGYLRFIRQYLEVLPIANANGKMKDELESLVEQMVQLNRQKQIATLSEQIEQLEQRIAYTDKRINDLVYKLYGLSEDEIEIVEGR
jgi:cell division protein FtsB